MPAQLSGPATARRPGPSADHQPSRCSSRTSPAALDDFLRLQVRGELRRLPQAEHYLYSRNTHTARGHCRGRRRGGDARPHCPGRPGPQIYTRPHNAYVARLMGGHDLLDRTVTALAHGIATLMSASGEAMPHSFQRRASRWTRRWIAPFAGIVLWSPKRRRAGPPCLQTQHHRRHGPGHRISRGVRQSDYPAARMRTCGTRGR